MKRPLFVLLVLSAFLLSRCEEDDDPVRGELVFSFDVLPEPNGKTSGQIREGSSILITLHKSNGESLLSLHKVELLKIGTHFVSKPLLLPPGRYTVEDLLVAKDEEVMFVIPKKGSKLASLVDNALPYEVLVTERRLTTASLSVVNVENKAPEDLGYSTFEARIVHPILISVFKYKNGRLELTNANVTLSQGDSIFLDAKVHPKINVLPFTGDASEDYTLRISKNGYETVVLPFNYGDYADEFGLIPITVILTPESFASVTVTEDPLFYLTAYQSGSISVRWPDGLQETLDFRPQPGDSDKLSFYQLTHSLEDSIGDVRLSGDLDHIVEFAAVTPLRSLDIKKIVNLRSLTLENSSVQVLDLASNRQLTSLAFVNTNIEQITLPDDHSIDNILVEGTADVPATFPIDILIADVYDNAVEKNIMEGAVILFNAGPISDSAANKLVHLQEAYGWYVEVE